MKNAVRMLEEGEGFTELVRLARGVKCRIIPHYSESADLYTIRLFDPMGSTIVPQVDAHPAGLYFTAPHDGYYMLKVVLQEIADGATSAWVGVTIRTESGPKRLAGRTGRLARTGADDVSLQCIPYLRARPWRSWAVERGLER